MNTKVKVGIAAVVFSALVALIVLDRKTGPQNSTYAPGPGGAVPSAASAPSAGAHPEGETMEINLFNESLRRLEPPPASSGVPIQGAQEMPDSAPASDFHTVKPGDTLADIAGKKYGDRSKWEIIAKANPTLTRPGALPVGRKILIPPLETRRPETVPASAPAPAAAGSEAAHPAEEKIYVVQPGDTLTDISKKLYNTTRHYQMLFEVNRDRISDPNDLRSGMKLVLPEGVARQENVAPVAAPAPQTGAAVLEEAPGKRVHHVKPNESLWKIAEQYAAGRGILPTIESIVQANPEKFREGTRTLLRVGWPLVIPE